ncbi:MAG TPA: 50S ribosomal protein L29 [Anaeromyxobacteraceae bacterium]|nr:50S ribosomal protein L29 [Anaeromyxobacteraceae bacterium]
MATAKELRELQPQELEERARELKRQIFDMKSKHNTGVLDSTADLGKARRDVARCLTVKAQKARAAAAQGGEKGKV